MPEDDDTPELFDHSQLDVYLKVLLAMPRNPADPEIDMLTLYVYWLVEPAVEVELPEMDVMIGMTGSLGVAGGSYGNMVFSGTNLEGSSCEGVAANGSFASIAG